MMQRLRHWLHPLRQRWFPNHMVDRHNLEHTVRELVGMDHHARTACRYHGNLVSPALSRYKRSDTVFILGSGPSIQRIDAEQWEHVAQHDSIGFNYWMMHPFVPSMYVWQFDLSEAGMHRERFLLQDHAEAYAKVPMLVRGSVFAQGGVGEDHPSMSLLKQFQVYYLREFPWAKGCALAPELLYDFMESLGYLRHGVIADFVPKWRSSLGMLISWSYQMGYSRIVLCGMDMNSSGHFWDADSFQEQRVRYRLPPPGACDLHEFTDPRISPNTVPRYVATLGQWMRQRAGVEMSVINDGTVLYPALPLYTPQASTDD